MIRYVISFPGEMRMERMEYLAQKLKELADDREWRDLILAEGGTITDMRRRPVSSLVRRARAKAR